jgi:trimeric autotransporter adhesin
MAARWQEFRVQLLLVLLSLLLLPTSASAQIVNVTSIQQIGDFNTATVDQGDGQNQALIGMTGDSNRVSIEQNRLGDLGVNTADVALLGTANVLAIIQNYAESASITTAGDNSVTVMQTGDNNQMSLDQAGSNNAAKLDQTGNDNVMSVRQENDGNSAEITQTGTGLSIGIVQSDGGPPVIINQVN